MLIIIVLLPNAIKHWGIQPEKPFLVFHIFYSVMNRPIINISKSINKKMNEKNELKEVQSMLQTFVDRNSASVV